MVIMVDGESGDGEVKVMMELLQMVSVGMEKGRSNATVAV